MDEIQVIKKGSGRFVVFHESEFGLTEQRFKDRKSALYYYDNLKTERRYFYKDRMFFNSTIKIILLFGTVIILSLVVYKLIEYFDIATLSDAVELSYETY